MNRITKNLLIAFAGGLLVLLATQARELASLAVRLYAAYPRVAMLALVAGVLAVPTALVARRAAAKMGGAEGKGFFARHGHASFLALAAPAAALAIWITFTQVLSLSVLAAGAGQAVILVLLTALHDRTILRNVNTFERVTDDPIALAIYAGLVSVAFGLCIGLA